MRASQIAVTATVISVAAAIGLPARPAMADSVRDGQWYIRSLQVAEANRITSGQGLIVAIVDTGVYPHVDLRKNLLAGTSVFSGTDNGQSDETGHGTEMAGLIAAHGHSDQAGIVGIAPRAKILPVKDTNSEGGGNTLRTAKAFQWSIDHGAKIINFSGAVGPSIALDAAIQLAAEKDVLIVAASGNRSQDVVAAYPAAIPGVLSVGASDQAGKPTDFSVPGKNIQICAPGVDIESTSPNNRYSNREGTSEATAIVSGAAALVRAKFPQLSAQEVIHRLTATATDNGPPGRDDKCGYGVLNIVKALTADVPPLQTTPSGTPSAAATPAGSPAQSGAATPHHGRNTPAIIGGVLFVLFLAGLFIFLALKRRKSA